MFEETLKRQAPAEAKVLFALRDGPKTHTELFKATGLSGSHVADVKKSLKKKDLVSAPKESRGVWTYKGPTK